jgi:excisionase family DNA binding protein
MSESPRIPGKGGSDETVDLMTTQEVARRAGVGPTAVKRWADTGLLRCIRTGGGHRRFLRSEVERLIAGRSEELPSEREPWVGALLEPGDTLALQSLLLAERARSGAWHRVAATAGQALGAIGTLWRSGALTVLEEHRASERLGRALARVTESIPLQPDAPRALLACADGEEHTLGLSLVELVLREAGWSALWAGRRTPVEELGPALAKGRARMLAISASEGSSDALALRRQADALSRIARVAGVALVLGGAGAWPDRPRHGLRFHDLEPFYRYASKERAALEGPPAA